MLIDLIVGARPNFMKLSPIIDSICEVQNNNIKVLLPKTLHFNLPKLLHSQFPLTSILQVNTNRLFRSAYYILI